MARVPYQEPAALPDDVGDLVISSLQGRPVHVYQAIANNPAILDGLRTFLGTLWSDTGLTDRQRELVILASAKAAGSTYEWHQHVRIARDDYLTAEEIAAVGVGEFEGFEPTERTLLEYATAVVEGAVDDAVHEAASEIVDDEAMLVGTAATAAGYLGLGRLIDALGVEIEDGEPFVGWTLDG